MPDSIRCALLHCVQNGFDGWWSAYRLDHPLFGSEPAEAVDSGIFLCKILLLRILRQMFFQLILHDMSERIIRQIHRCINHVAIHSQQNTVMLAKNRFVIFVPDIFGNLQCSIAELFGRSVMVVVYPSPHSHIHEADTHNLVH